MKKKSVVTPQEFAEELLKLRQIISKNFFLEFKEYLKENEISINQKDELLYSEIAIMSLWAIVFAFQSDEKKDAEFLNILIDKHIEESKKSFETHREKKEAIKYTREMISDRFNKYFEAWDNKSDGQQTILSLKMLECMGIPKEELLHFLLLTYVNTWILNTMYVVLDFRLNFEIVNL